MGISVNILGLSGLAHDSAAALLSDAGVLAAMEESKLVRMRTAAGIPREAILPGACGDGPGPMLVNNSFNLFGEPLVIAPRDAVRSYFCSGVDALVIGNFTLAKT